MNVGDTTEQLGLFSRRARFYDVELAVCCVPDWLRLLRQQVCRSRAQWDWLSPQP